MPCQAPSLPPALLGTFCPTPSAMCHPASHHSPGHQQGAAGKWAEPDPCAKLGEIKASRAGQLLALQVQSPGGSSLPAQSRWGQHAGQSPKAPCRAWGGCAALWARGSARLVCTRQNAAPADTPALCAPGRFLWARHSLCQAMTFPAADTHAPVPHSGTHARAGHSYLGHPGPGAAPKRPIARAGDTHTQAWHGTSTLI